MNIETLKSAAEKATPGPWEAVAYIAAANPAAVLALIASYERLLVVARDFSEVLGELGLHCECGEADCRTTRLRAAIAQASGSAA